MVYRVQFPGLGLDPMINRVALAIVAGSTFTGTASSSRRACRRCLYAFRNAVDYGIDSPSGDVVATARPALTRLCLYLLRS